MSVNPNYRGIVFPSEHQYVILDTSTYFTGLINDLTNNLEESTFPKYKNLSHIPMVFSIDYSRLGIYDQNPPELTLLINPNNMSLNFTKKIVPTYARDGYIVEEWGEELDVIQCSGKIGGYYIFKGQDISGQESMNGLNRYSRSKSLSFKNITKLLYIFRNNGAIYQNSSFGDEENKLIQTSGYIKIDSRVPRVLKSNKNRIDRVGDIYLNYDSTIYLGSFDSFSMTENAESPFTLDYNFQFTVQRTTRMDYRDLDYYYQDSEINQDAYKYSTKFKKFKRLLKNIINVQKSAKLQEKANKEEFVNSKVDTPILYPEIKSKVSPNQIALRGKGLLIDNGYEVTSKDTEDLKVLVTELDSFRNAKANELNYKAYRYYHDQLITKVKDIIKTSKPNYSETDAYARANNLAQQMLKDLPKPVKDDNALADVINMDLEGLDS